MVRVEVVVGEGEGLTADVEIPATRHDAILSIWRGQGSAGEATSVVFLCGLRDLWEIRREIDEFLAEMTEREKNLGAEVDAETFPVSPPRY